MKPRKGWVIGPGSASARRRDGVFAGFIFSHRLTPFAAYRPRQSLKRGRVDEWLAGTTGVARCFRTLEAVMIAVDKAWPLK